METKTNNIVVFLGHYKMIETLKNQKQTSIVINGRDNYARFSGFYQFLKDFFYTPDNIVFFLNMRSKTVHELELFKGLQKHELVTLCILADVQYSEFKNFLEDSVTLP